MTGQGVVLVHNPGAGEGEWTLERLRAGLAAAGLAVTRDMSSGDAEAFAALRGLVAVAGGDGTVAKLAKCLHGAEAELAIVPIGGANNIARSLGLPRDPGAALAGLAAGRRAALHVGRMEGASGTHGFVESVGLGPIARAAWRMPQEGVSREEKRVRGREVIRNAVHEADPIRAAVTIDGEPLREAALMLEAMNIPLVGPGLRLAPDADPGDADLVVAWLPLDAREAMMAWLENPEAGPPPMQWRRGRRVEIHVAGDAVRVDDELLKAVRGGVSLELLPHPVPLLLPGATPA